jgi:hypothetical protein
VSNLVEKWFDALGDRVAEEGSRVRAVLEAGLAQTANANRLRGARPLQVRNGLLWGGPGRLAGWSVWANGGPVRLILHDGRDTGGDVLAVVDLIDQENDTTNLVAPAGVSFGEALYAEIIGTGALIGAVYTGAHD